MGALVEALLVPRATAVRDAVVANGGVVVPLRAPHLWLVPVDTGLRVGTRADDGEVVDGFHDLTEPVTTFAADLSRHGRTGYVHVELHGGTGTHSALGWADGTVAWGPSFTTNEPPSEPFRHLPPDAPPSEWAVNALLGWLGVTPGDEVDEFAAVGLTAHRWTEDWTAAATPG